MHIQPLTHGEPHKAMKVLFILPNVAIGGVERVRLALMQQFVADGIECLLALRRCRGELIDQVRSVVPVHELAPKGIHQFIPALVRLIRRENPTHVVSAFSDVGVLTWLALRMSRSHAKWVHSADNTHSSVASRSGFWGMLRSLVENRMVGFTYRRVDATVAVSHGIRQEILKWYGVSPSRVTAIYNPVVPGDELLKVNRKRTTSQSVWKIVAVGRLVRQKGFDVLVRAMADVPGIWCLDIWGEGPECSNLRDLICQYRLEKKVNLRGYTSQPFEVMRDADIYVMASRHEGLGNTLIEALACQCQVVATDCPQGPREILEGGKLGQLVPVGDSSALAGAITNLIGGKVRVDPKLLLDRAAHFSRAESCHQWETLLRSL